MKNLKQCCHKCAIKHLVDGIFTDVPCECIEFIRDVLAKSKQEGINQEKERWINQPANQHDKKIRQEIMTEITKLLESKRHTNEDCKDDGCGVNQTISDLLTKLKNIK